MTELQPRVPTPYGILGKLPTEIRLQIYENLFSNKYTFMVPRDVKHNTQMADINVLITSSIILTEAKQPFYEQGLFVLRLSPPGYLYICGGVANVPLIKKVQLDIDIGFHGLNNNLAKEARNPRKRPFGSLAGAHDLDLYWIMPQWFSQMSLSICLVSFGLPLLWTPLGSWCRSYIYSALSLCNMGISCDTLALAVEFKAPDSSKISSTSIRLAECSIDRFSKDMECFLGPGMVKDLSYKSHPFLPVFQATLQYHPHRHNDRYLSRSYEEKS